MYDMGKLQGMPILPASGHHARKHSELDATKAMRTLLANHPASPPEETAAAHEALSFSELRDRLLALGPLDVEWVKQVNAAEVCQLRTDDLGR